MPRLVRIILQLRGETSRSRRPNTRFRRELVGALAERQGALDAAGAALGAEQGQLIAAERPSHIAAESRMRTLAKGLVIGSLHCLRLVADGLRDVLLPVELLSPPLDFLR